MRCSLSGAVRRAIFSDRAGEREFCASGWPASRLAVETPRPCKTEAMDFILDADEVRVLGALLEKEITTPEYYPLSLNALLNACNQKSNRDPVVHFDEDTVERVLYTLRDKGLLLNITGAGSRVPKYGHRLSEKLNLGRRELAVAL